MNWITVWMAQHKANPHIRPEVIGFRLSHVIKKRQHLIDCEFIVS